MSETRFRSKSQVLSPKRDSKLSLLGTSLRSSVSEGYSSKTSGFGIIQNHYKFEHLHPPPKFDQKNLKLWWGGKWVYHKAKYTMLSLYGPPYYNYSGLASANAPEDVRGELIRFLLTLELWDRTPGPKEITAREVWNKSLELGPAYAKELDDLFGLSWREKDRESYNFIFPSRYLPRWEEETNDLDLSAESVEADPDVLDEFRSTLIDLLDEIDWDKVRVPSDNEILLERSTTTSYIHKMDKTMPQWQASLMNPVFNEKELIGKRQKVPVYPGGVRDTIIADVSANHSIRWIERLMRHILEYVPESADSLYSSTFANRMDNVIYSYGYHVLRDIKKCGITYNVKSLFPIVKQELATRLNDRRIDRMNIFNHLIVIDPIGGSFETNRGYGLGMANHTVTLCNIVIHRMCINSINASNPKDYEVRSIFGNDDCDVCFVKRKRRDVNDADWDEVTLKEIDNDERSNRDPIAEKLAYDYLELEHDIHGRLGNLTNVKKSVIKRFGLFYENYSLKGWKDKESLVTNALACAYLAPSIRVAKHYIYSQSDRFHSEWARRELYHLAKFWGGEFFDFESELYVHFEVGGWLNTTSRGLKTTLADIDYLMDKMLYNIKEISYAYQSAKMFLEGPKPRFRTPGQVNNGVYFGPAKKSDPRVQIYTLTDKDLEEYYKELTTFQRRYDARLANFKVKQSKIKKFHLTRDELFSELLNDKPMYTIPGSMVTYTSSQYNFPWDYTTELYRYDDDPLQTLIEGGELHPEDANFTWDVKIHPHDMGTIHTGQWAVMWGSQFSNSGYLPLLDYLEKNKEICNVRVLGRVRHPPESKEKSIIHKGLQRHSYKFKQIKDESARIPRMRYEQPEPKEEELEPLDAEEVFRQLELARQEVPVDEHRFIKTSEDVIEGDIDNLISQIENETSNLEYPSVREGDGGDDSDVDIFADGDDEPMDFGMFD